MAERTYLHVGTSKSGTAYLQGVLWKNVDALRSNDVLLPGRMTSHYAAARAVTDADSAPDDQSDGPTDGAANDSTDDTAWTKLVRQINRWSGTAIVSHDLFATASPGQVAAAAAPLLGDVHIVVSARALHHQPASSWQEQVRSGRTTSFDAFLERLRDDRPRGRRFWRVHDVADVARRWQGRLPASQVHIVTMPPEPDPRLLWDRYAGAIGIDPTAYDSAASRQPLTLGAVEIELLRQVHARHDPRFSDRHRHVWTRQLLANELLGRRPAAAIRLPDAVLPWLSERSDAILTSLQDEGYVVAGDLADLGWSDPPPDARIVGEISRAELHELAAWTVLRLQEELVHREPVAVPPRVAPDDGIDGILELLEHIRAADTGAAPRPAPERDISTADRIWSALPRLRGR